VSYRTYRSSHRARQAAALLALVLVAAVAAGAAARAQTPTGAGPEVIAAAVTIGGVPVGGLGVEGAAAAVRASFERPLELALAEDSVTVAPAAVGARAHLYPALGAALAASPGARIPVTVTVGEDELRGWMRALARSWNRSPQNSEIVLHGARPFVTKARFGRKLLARPAASRIRAALVEHRREVDLPVRRLPPALTRESAGAVVVVRRETRRLTLYEGMRPVRTFGVAVGLPQYPTPLGSFEIVTKQRDPWWNPPDSDWAAGAEPVPPGPGNPLGTRWLGISVDSVGIHGTPDAASIGYSASHGCVRMRIPEAEWLFERVEMGTPVFIVAA
jgi:lipoprotein-anchoring transpeptidase ErfK/SrfK